MAIVKEQLANGIMITKKRSNGWSQVWTTFEEIRSISDKDKETFFVRCTLCAALIYKPNSNTNPLHRHKCGNGDSKKISKVSITDKNLLKLAAAKFVSKDIRPYFAVECEGLIDLCTACMLFGQNNRNATRANLVTAMPSRNTVRATVKEIAQSNREKISEFIKCAIETGGISCTTDTWKDNYRKNTYISAVLHLTCAENEIVKHHRYVISTSEITEFVKTGINLKFSIISNNVYDEFKKKFLL